MSQPLSQKLGRVPLAKPEKQSPYITREEAERAGEPRSLPLRDAIVLLLVLVALVCVPTGFAIALGVGAAVASVGVLAFLLAIVLGL